MMKIEMPLEVLVEASLHVLEYYDYELKQAMIDAIVEIRGENEQVTTEDAVDLIMEHIYSKLCDIKRYHSD